MEELARCAVNSQYATGIPASVTIAQGILESGYGRSSLAEVNNIFGIKGRTGVTTSTNEEINGQTIRVTATFQTFNSLEEACLRHNQVFYNGKYDDALPYRGDAREFLMRIAPVYATDSQYASKLLVIMDRHNLWQYDVPVLEWRLDARVIPLEWVISWAVALHERF